LAVAADHVRFMQMGTRVGLVDAGGATQWLPLVIGERREREMLLTCDEVTADQTLTTGHARDWLAVHATSWEPYEGIQAFIEKRPPDTKHLRELAAGKSSEFLWGAYTRKCESCGGKGIPEKFDYCGKCGGKLK
jgi:1,4-dihydroxy-2-naphthoyl-CoA synthase